jgi:hypothetical protein
MGSAKWIFQAAEGPLLQGVDALHGGQPSPADDPHPIAQRFHLGKDVGGKEHRPPVGPGLGDQPVHLVLEEGIQARGGRIRRSGRA